MRVSKNQVILLSAVVAALFAVGAQAFAFDRSDQPQFLQPFTANVQAMPAPVAFGRMNAVIMFVRQDDQSENMRNFFALASTARKTASATKAVPEPTRDPWKVQNDRAQKYAVNIDHRPRSGGYDRNKSAETGS